MRKAFSSLLAALLIAVSASVAQAAGLSPVVADCNTNLRLTHHYSVAQLRSALASMPADVREYTNCGDVIQRRLLAQLGALRGHGGSAGGGGSFLPTPVILVLALLVAGGVGFAAYAYRRRGSERRPG